MMPTKNPKIPTNIFEQSTENRIEYLTLKTPEIPSFRLVYIPGGTFIMQEGKAKQKVILSSFYMAEFPVTQDLYEVVKGENLSAFKGPRRPIETISWYYSVRFCNLLSKKIGLKEYYFVVKNTQDPNNKNKGDSLKWLIRENKGANGFRLPTEAQWEYGAKGGNKVDILKPLTYAGSSDLENVGWYSENSHRETKPAGLKFPNELGLFDMNGNVLEWCWDWHGAYQSGNLTDRRGPKQGSRRVIRGGSWSDDAEWCTPVRRRIMNPRDRNELIGFRVVFVP
jgi:formylglycine-generating enzyme